MRQFINQQTCHFGVDPPTSTTKMLINQPGPVKARSRFNQDVLRAQDVMLTDILWLSIWL